MAFSEGSQRRKRAWRKPREEIGPGIIHPDSSSSIETASTESDHLKPKRINRTTLKEPMSSSEPEPVCTIEQSSPEPTSIGSVSMDRSSVEEGLNGGSSVTVGGAEAPLIIDGSVMEGGGQILRISMALNCLLNRSITVTNIRAGRDKPGLRPQHLTGIELLAQMCGGRLKGEGIGSSEVTLCPQAIRGGHFTADTRTAGSVCLLLQAALPCLLFAPKSSKVTLKGGTNADMAPPIDYAIKVFQPIAARFGVQFDCRVVRRGFYPKGCGEVEIATPTGPVPHLTAVTMTDPGTLVGITIHAFVAGAVPINACHKMVMGARKALERQLPGVGLEVKEVQETRDSAFGNSSGIIIVAETSTGCLLAGSANGRKSDPADKTGRAAADELVRGVRSGGCVDEHLQDQLIILMALARGRSTIRTGPLTLHTQTAIHIAQLLTKAKFWTERVSGEKREVHLIHCDGIGLENKLTTPL
ncbi:RNA 3'-terminal phosphate cyclase-like isoform X2 [Halichondria panicea]|uniref:RNA 3'-terminal phosphate cyclase-like isoform X2 n=1 Tax=Halichondria panicea TaxID=6063 RepID=UPI00312B59C4